MLTCWLIKKRLTNKILLRNAEILDEFTWKFYSLTILRISHKTGVGEIDQCDRLCYVIQANRLLCSLAPAHVSSFTVRCSSPRVPEQLLTAGAENLVLSALSKTATSGVYCSDQTFRGFHNRAEVLLLTVDYSLS